MPAWSLHLPREPSSRLMNEVIFQVSLYSFMDKLYNVKIFLLVLIFNLVLTALISALPGSSSFGRLIDKQLSSEVPSPSSDYLFSGVYIGLHNFLIALGMSIPLVGFLWGIFSLSTTAYAFASLGAMDKVPGIFFVANEAFLPFFWFEFICYSTMMGESLILFRTIVSGKFQTSVLKNYVFLVIGVLITLIISGYVEAAFIDLEKVIGL